MDHQQAISNITDGKFPTVSCSSYSKNVLNVKTALYLFFGVVSGLGLNPISGHPSASADDQEKYI